MNNAVGNGTILIYSPVVLAEFKRRVHQYVYEQYSSALQIQPQGPKKPWKVLEDQRNPTVGQASVAAWQQAKTLIINPDSIEAYMPSLDVLEQTSNRIISKYGMGVGDAEHLAVIHHNEVNSVLTLDGGFVGAENINIFSASNTVLRHGVASSNTLIPYTPFSP
jgi:predicted nucleic acid-binding protein